jgi:hypothetical protein
MNENFWKYTAVKSADECWLWFGYKDKDGYGRITINYKDLRAHRVSYEFFHGSTNQLVRHSCDVKNCVNPNHLISGTSGENSGDMVARNRSLTGERNPSAKLNWTVVREIRHRYKIEKISKKQLAKAYNITDVMACKIINNKNWKE